MAEEDECDLPSSKSNRRKFFLILKRLNADCLQKNYTQKETRKKSSIRRMGTAPIGVKAGAELTTTRPGAPTAAPLPSPQGEQSNEWVLLTATGGENNFPVHLSVTSSSPSKTVLPPPPPPWHGLHGGMKDNYKNKKTEEEPLQNEALPTAVVVVGVVGGGGGGSSSSSNSNLLQWKLHRSPPMMPLSSTTTSSSSPSPLFLPYALHACCNCRHPTRPASLCASCGACFTCNKCGHTCPECGQLSCDVDTIFSANGEAKCRACYLATKALAVLTASSPGYNLV